MANEFVVLNGLVVFGVHNNSFFNQFFEIFTQEKFELKYNSTKDSILRYL